jgi:hypothetical protein
MNKCANHSYSAMPWWSSWLWWWMPGSLRVCFVRELGVAERFHSYFRSVWLEESCNGAFAQDSEWVGLPKSTELDGSWVWALLLQTGNLSFSLTAHTVITTAIGSLRPRRLPPAPSQGVRSSSPPSSSRGTWCWWTWNGGGAAGSWHRPACLIGEEHLVDQHLHLLQWRRLVVHPLLLSFLSCPRLRLVIPCFLFFYCTSMVFLSYEKQRLKIRS